MDQFSHDLTLALEETSLVDTSRWMQRRRTRSTGNLPCAPLPTEDSSSTDNAHKSIHPKTNVDGLDTHNVVLPSDSEDDNEEMLMRLTCKSGTSATRLGTNLESDSLNENFSPARFFKPNARRKRKLKRMSVEYDLGASQNVFLESTLGNSTMRKRGLKPDPSNRTTLFFCGKRKRSNRDRYHEYDVKFHSSSVPRHNYLDEFRMRPRSYSSTTTKTQTDRLLPLNKGLVSKIEKIAQQQKTSTACTSSAAKAMTENPEIPDDDEDDDDDDDEDGALACAAMADVCPLPSAATLEAAATGTQQLRESHEKCLQEQTFQGHRKKSNRHARHRSQLQQQLQFAVDQHPMDCEELYDLLSSSSLSSSESDCGPNATNDTDREGDDELTDWPGNEVSSCLVENRKLTKKPNLLSSIISGVGSGQLHGDEETLMGVAGAREPSDIDSSHEKFVIEPARFQSSDPITIAGRSVSFGDASCTGVGGGGGGVGGSGSSGQYDTNIPLKQIESEMSGETSNPFLSSPPCQPTEVREIRAGCRRIKDERPGFSIKTSVNERLARFLQDPRQSEMRLPDIEIYEHDSLISLAALYSLTMSLDNAGCAVLSKTSNTTQSVNIDQQNLQGRLLFSDFKRRCYDGKSSAKK